MVLRCLGGPIIESLRSDNLQAAEAHIRDVIAAINNESAWCYDTDSDLPHMAAYFATLHDTCARVRHAEPKKRGELVKELITTIETILQRMAHLLCERVEEPAPDTHLGIDEIEHRQRRYADPSKAAPAIKVFD